MNKSRKPKFDEGSGGIINAARLPENDLRRLSLKLPASMTEDEREIFLHNTSEIVDMWEMNTSKQLMAATEISERIEKMEFHAKALQRAIEGLQGDPYDAIYPHFDYLIWGNNPPIELPEELRSQKTRLGTVLESTWETLQTLRKTGDYARSKFQIDRTSKPATQSAKSLVFRIVESYHGQFGNYPPSHKIAWFPDFMTELGEILNLEVKFGFNMISTVIKRIQQKFDPEN